MKAERVRRIARKVLQEAGGKMSFTELFREVRTLVDTPLRYDLMQKSLLLYPGRFQLRRRKGRVFMVLAHPSRKEVSEMSSARKNKERVSRQPRVTPEKFVFLAIEHLRNPDYKTEGIHSVFSGFNRAFRAYFPKLDPIEVVKQLVEDGKVSTRPVKGGVMIYPGRRVFRTPDAVAKEALGKMGL